MDGPDGQQQHSVGVQDLTQAVRPRANQPGSSVAGLSPVVGPVVRQGMGHAETVHLPLPTLSGQSSPADGSLFGVSPDTPGFMMHPMTLPVYTMPTGASLIFGSDSLSVWDVSSSCTVVHGYGPG